MITSYLFGFLFSYFYAKYLIKKGYFEINFSNFEDFLGWAVIGVVFGGRIGYVIFYNFDFYYQNPMDIVKIWKGGMSFQGGLLEHPQYTRPRVFEDLEVPEVLLSGNHKKIEEMVENDAIRPLTFSSIKYKL